MFTKLLQFLWPFEKDAEYEIVEFVFFSNHCVYHLHVSSAFFLFECMKQIFTQMWSLWLQHSSEPLRCVDPPESVQFIVPPLLWYLENQTWMNVEGLNSRVCFRPVCVEAPLTCTYVRYFLPPNCRVPVQSCPESGDKWSWMKRERWVQSPCCAMNYSDVTLTNRLLSGSIAPEFFFFFSCLSCFVSSAMNTVITFKCWLKLPDFNHLSNCGRVAHGTKTRLKALNHRGPGAAAVVGWLQKLQDALILFCLLISISVDLSFS